MKKLTSALSLSLLVAACGGDGSNSTSDSGTLTPQSVGVNNPAAKQAVITRVVQGTTYTFPRKPAQLTQDQIQRYETIFTQLDASLQIAAQQNNLTSSQSDNLRQILQRLFSTVVFGENTAQSLKALDTDLQQFQIFVEELSTKFVGKYRFNFLLISYSELRHTLALYDLNRKYQQTLAWLNQLSLQGELKADVLKRLRDTFTRLNTKGQQLVLQDAAPAIMEAYTQECNDAYRQITIDLIAAKLPATVTADMLENARNTADAADRDAEAANDPIKRARADQLQNIFEATLQKFNFVFAEDPSNALVVYTAYVEAYNQVERLKAALVKMKSDLPAGAPTSAAIKITMRQMKVQEKKRDQSWLAYAKIVRKSTGAGGMGLVIPPQNNTSAPIKF